MVGVVWSINKRFNRKIMANRHWKRKESCLWLWCLVLDLGELVENSSTLGGPADPKSQTGDIGFTYIKYQVNVLESRRYSQITPVVAFRVFRRSLAERFSCWSFHSTFNEDSTALNGGGATGCVTLRERQMLLRAHNRPRIENMTPAFVNHWSSRLDMYDFLILTNLTPKIFTKNEVQWTTGQGHFATAGAL